MEIRFCDICNESVPETDLNRGRAYVRKGRVICATCEASMSGEEDEGGAGYSGTGTGTGTGSESVSAGVSAPGVFAAPAPPPVHAPARNGAAVLLAGLMGTVALIVTSVVTVVLVERLQASAGAAEGERTRIEGEVSREVARLEAVLERWREEDRELVREELLAARTDAGRSHARIDDRVAEVRGEIEALRDITIRIDELETLAEVRGGELRSVGTDLAQIKRDVGVLAERWMEAVAMGDVAPQVEPDDERPPEWMEHARGLESPNAATRWTAVTELGRAGDPGAVPYLVGMLTDPDIFVRMATARVLGELGSNEAVPALIDALTDEELPVREAAVFALRTVTGENFRYEPDAPEADRARRIKAWRDWWKKNNKA